MAPYVIVAVVGPPAGPPYIRTEAGGGEHDLPTGYQ